ncbi:MAG TPA: MBOAT family O-acyltransferase [Acidimicrobiales bacterium]|nr:MBOAT family O-acyltransferase [Acidimicrobiales bacterium]
MPFPTATFAAFFVVAFTLNWLLRPHPPVWRASMVALSLYFCAWVDVRFAVLVVALAMANAGLAAAVGRTPGRAAAPAGRRMVALAVALDLGVLAAFAYHGFFLDSATDVLRALGLSATAPSVGLVVPVGLSIVTLNAIGYVVDVGRGDVDPVPGGDVLLYLCFFPHLVAGPPVRVDELVPQFRRRPDPRRVPATEAFALVGTGLLKAVVVAGYLATEMVDPVFARPDQAGAVTLVVALYALAVQVYASFSGLTDVAVGCALLLGIEYPRPFDAPYRSSSVREFWDRWNTPVSHWLRDYVYVPLGGSRAGAGRTYRNLAVTTVLGALWYGPAWPVVVWGLVHGAYLVAERARAGRAGEAPEAAVASRGATVARGVATFHLVALAWVFYRADSLGTAGEVLGRIVTLAPGGSLTVPALAVLVVVGALAAQLAPAGAADGVRARFTTLAPAAQVAVLAAGLTVVSVLGPDGSPPATYLPF